MLRREATDFYRTVHPLLGPLDALERGSYSEVNRERSQFFRDVNDHLKPVNEEVAALRDVLATVLQANMAVISTQQNEISVRQNWVFAVYGLGTLLASAAGIYLWLRRSGHIGSK